MRLVGIFKIVGMYLIRRILFAYVCFGIEYCEARSQIPMTVSQIINAKNRVLNGGQKALVVTDIEPLSDEPSF